MGGAAIGAQPAQRLDGGALAIHADLPVGGSATTGEDQFGQWWEARAPGPAGGSTDRIVGWVHAGTAAFDGGGQRDEAGFGRLPLFGPERVFDAVAPAELDVRRTEIEDQAAKREADRERVRHQW